MLSNIGYGVIIDAINGESLILGKILLGLKSAQLTITMLDPVSIHTDSLYLSRSFSLNRSTPLDSPSKVSGIFLITKLKS